MTGYVWWFVIGFGLLVAELAVAHDRDAKLGSPVPKMIVGHNLVAQKSMQPIQGIADVVGTEMPDVKRLGDVG